MPMTRSSLETLKKRFLTVALSAGLLVAVPAGALVLWGGSAQAQTSIGDLVIENRLNDISILLAAANDPVQQKIDTKATVRASEQRTINPTSPILQRFR